MAEQCCWYMATNVPSTCSGYMEGDIVKGACDGICNDLRVEEAGPCYGMVLIALEPECSDCEGPFGSTGGVTLEQATAAARAKGRPENPRPISLKELQGSFRRA